MKLRMRRVVALGLIVSSLVQGGAASALYSDAAIERGLVNGVATAHAWDAECFENMRSRGYSERFISSGMGELRSIINSGSSYADQTWLSKRGQGNAAVPVTVTAGTTNLPLQINDVIFLCGPLVSPDLNSGSRCSTSIYGREILYQNGSGGTPASRWVVNDSQANDRDPNNFGAGCMYPARAFQRTRIVSLTVAADSTIPGRVSGGPGGDMNTWRNENSRYWFGNAVPISFIPNNPIDSSGRIHIVMRYKKFSAYHSTNERAATKNCNGSGPSYVSGALLDINRCETLQTDLYIRIALASDFVLTPSIAIDNPRVSTFGGVERVSPSVTNSGRLSADKDVDWRVTRFVLNPGASYGVAGGSQAPCDAFTGFPASTCAQLRNGTERFAAGATALPAFDDSIGEYPIGTKICYFTSVKPYKYNVDEWRHSTPQCAIVGKQLASQFQGNDVRVGSAFLGVGVSTAKIEGIVLATRDGYKGSWAEYAAIAPASIASFSSGSGLAINGATPAQAQWSRLTFSNTAAIYGRFATADKLGSQPDMATYFTRTGLQGVVIDSAPAPAGATVGGFESKVIYRPGGTVEITANIINNDNANLQTVDSFPQMVIIARDIAIRSGVDRVDAWLIAKKVGAVGGTINTCSDGPAALTNATCNRPLTITGPVIADRLLLRRTAGDHGDPAEIINLRSDAYLWAHRLSEKNARWDTKYVEELPPRY